MMSDSSGMTEEIITAQYLQCGEGEREVSKTKSQCICARVRDTWKEMLF